MNLSETWQRIVGIYPPSQIKTIKFSYETFKKLAQSLEDSHLETIQSILQHFPDSLLSWYLFDHYGILCKHPETVLVIISSLIHSLQPPKSNNIEPPQTPTTKKRKFSEM